MDHYNFFGSGVGGSVTPRTGPGRVRWLGDSHNAQNNAPATASPTTLTTSDPLKLGIVALVILYATGTVGYTAGARSAKKTVTQTFKPKDVRNISHG